MRKISTLALAKTMAGLLLVSALGGGTAYAASTVANNGLLDQQEAETFAFMDADVKEDEVTNLRTHLEKDDGVYVYDIEFYVGNIEYEYEIRAEDGVVLDRDKEDRAPKVRTDAAANKAVQEEITPEAAAQIGEDAPEPAKEQPAQTSEAAPADAETGANAADKEEPAADNKYISVDRAKQIALEHAGLKEDEVKFTTAKFEDDGGRKEYDVEFYRGNLEYEYEIDAVTGRILDSEVETDD